MTAQPPFAELDRAIEELSKLEGACFRWCLALRPEVPDDDARATYEQAQRAVKVASELVNRARELHTMLHFGVVIEPDA